ncbi:MAG TPA: thioredoxin family protein [Bryobacteraceae bacterium]|nr:thioredoxin family protein [Bryobacteraceae bacterium]
MRAILITGALLLIWMSAPAQTAFAPLEQWKSAVLNGDRASLAKLYSVKPEAATLAGKDRIALRDELAFWAGLKKSGMSEFRPRLLEINTVNDKTELVLRISAISGSSHLVAGMRQEWVHEAGGWKIVASVRSSSFTEEAKRVLPQPAKPNVSLYSDPREGPAELKAALARAAKEGKRVLVVFGGNWCYDCHVLDATFHSKEFAPLVDANYVVVHINIGDEGKDNNDLAARLGVALDKGVPSLGVLAPNGKVVYAQKNGEFEATEKIGPSDVRAFLEKWKPRHG